MRSRTELVTTTFIDSEEDETESDDSEEDWRPDSSNRNGKKRKQKSRRLKRKSNVSSKSSSSSATTFSSFKRQRFETATFRDELLESDDGSYGGSTGGGVGVGSSSSGGGGGGGGGGVNMGISNFYHHQYFSMATNPISTIKSIPIIKDGRPLSQKVVAEQSMPDGSGIFQLYLYTKDLDKDYRTNLYLCLWRRDGSSLLQKYIRVKTNNSEDFIFTSSSVYSSWDERRRKDFAILAVKCLEENNRRVTILNISDLHALAEEVIRKKQLKIEEENSNDINENSQHNYDEEEGGDDDDDDDGAYDGSNVGDIGGESGDSNEADNGDEDENEEEFEKYSHSAKNVDKEGKGNENDDDDDDDDDTNSNDNLNNSNDDSNKA